MTVTVPTDFRIDAALPTGTAVLEASAGTGKTYAIESLAVRFVADGVPLERMLLVTFGRNATSELRERVRARFVDVDRAMDTGTPDSDDALLQLLRAGPPQQVADRRERVRAAVVGYDAATIETTHGFCNRVLDGLGLAAATDPAAVLVHDTDALVTEVITDVYLAEYGRPDAAHPLVPLSELRRLTREALVYPDARLEPVAAGAGTAAADRVRLTAAVRAEVIRRKQARGLRDYDDMVTRLRDALTDPVTGPVACRRLRQTYDVVMVDEFQDTDPVQWEIMRTAFHGHSTLVLVGDPKQAIYGFRGADVETYRSATRTTPDIRGLPVNHRSDAPLVAAVRHVLGNVELGTGIRVHDVTAAHAGSRLVGAGAPVRVRVVPRPGPATSRPRTMAVDRARTTVATDVAADIVGLLSTGVTYDAGRGPAALTPADVAVLVRTNEQGTAVRSALMAVGVPVTLSGAASVFAGDAAADWLVLLRALEQPHRRRLVGRAALTVLVGWTATRLGDATPDELDRLAALVRSWSTVLDRSGVAALLEVVTAHDDLPSRLLSATNGDRLITDVRHVAQALHEAATDGHRGVSALAAWLARQVAEASGDPSEERTQRLDSDAQAVRVLTVHRSKGLQYPLVYAPFLWDRFVPQTPDVLRLHDTDGHRVLDVGGPEGPGYADRLGRHRHEEAGEDLRLLYVALTRAKSQVVVWWAPATTAAAAPLHRLFLGRRDGDRVPTEVEVPSDDDAMVALRTLAEGSAGGVAVETVSPRSNGPFWRIPTATTELITPRAFERGIDATWRRTSYSSLTAGTHHPGNAGQPVLPGTVADTDVVHHDDEPDDAEDAAGPAATDIGPDSDEAALRAVRSPMADLPAGTSFGTLVHTVLETVDTAAPDLSAELLRRAEEAGGAVLPNGAAQLADALEPVLRTPLGPLAPGVSLADIGAGDRLSELDFELPLAGGDLGGSGVGVDGAGPGGAGATLSRIADLVRRHLHPGDPLWDYADALEALAGTGPSNGVMRGYLTGSIDSVLRVRDATGTSVHIVVDYKTNWLGGGLRAGDLTAWHYRPAVLGPAMIDAHYPLQALLYCVAVHRFLRWRQPGYDPHRHLGGVLYLFVRGMCGPGTPLVDGHPTGVFSWRPPAALVEALSALLDGRRT